VSDLARTCYFNIHQQRQPQSAPSADSESDTTRQSLGFDWIKTKALKLFYAFSSREPVPTSLGNALRRQRRRPRNFDFLISPSYWWASR
jgi:hypothetical protein